MKKLLMIVVVLVLLLVSVSVASYSKIDLTGNWSGKTKAMPYQLDLYLTLNLEHKDGKIVGKLSDNMKIINGDIFETELKDGVLSFKVIANVDDSPTVQFRLKITGNKIEGEWKSTDGVSGKWTAKRKTQAPEKKAPQSQKKSPSIPHPLPE